MCVDAAERTVASSGSEVTQRSVWRSVITTLVMEDMDGDAAAPLRGLDKEGYFGLPCPPL